MVTSKRVLTATTVLGLFGLGWLFLPNVLGEFWRIAPGENLTYMGHRYGALLVGLAVTVWLGRDLPSTQARRVIMIGAFVSLVLTTALSVYGGVALGLNAWPAVVVEAVLTFGLGWVLFIKPEPVG